VQTVGDVVNASTTRGTTLAPPASDHALGAWTVLSKTAGGPADLLAYPIEEVIIDLNQPTALSPLITRFLLNIAVGATGSEQIILENIPCALHTNTAVYGTTFIGPIPVHIPANTQIQARYQISNATAGSSRPVIDLTLYGLS
jgi:hypothetical protein